MNISLETLSWSNMKQVIIDFVRGKPNYSIWKDWYDGSYGLTMVEVLAGWAVNVRYMTMINRRECYLHYAQAYSSLLSMSEMFGYPVFRGSNTELTLSINPTSTVVVSEWDIIGTIQGENIVATESKALNQGVVTTLNVMLGTVKRETIPINTSDLKVHRFISTDISEKFRLYLKVGSTETLLPISSDVLDLNDDKYVILSNGVSGVDVFYLNEGSYQYAVGDELIIEYIALKDINWQDSVMTFFFVTFISKELINSYYPTQLKDSIVLKAPIYNETKNLIRGRHDFEKDLLTYFPNSVSTKGRDVDPAVVEVTFVLDTRSFLTVAQKTSFQDFITNKRPYGRIPCLISDPSQNLTKLKLTAYVQAGTQAPNILTDIQSKLGFFEDQLNLTTDLHQIENYIETLTYIKVARAKIGFNTWQTNTIYQKGSFVYSDQNNDYILKLVRLKSFSNSTQPTWNTTLRDITFDNEIVWRTEPNKINPDYWGGIPSIWSNNSEYKYYDTVKTALSPEVMYRCIGFRRKSALIEPVTWPIILKETLIDNKILWLTVEYEDTLNLWQADTFYGIGSKINPTTSTGFSYVCVQVCEKSNLIEPTWDFILGNETEDSNIVWECLDQNVIDLNVDWNEYVVFDREIEVIYDT